MTPRELREELEADFAYDGLATCAGDSMCQTTCPVKIDTGALVKELKAQATTPFAAKIAMAAAVHFGWTARLARAGLGAVAVARALRLGSFEAGGRLVEAVSAFLNERAPALVPKVARDMPLPRPAPAVPRPRVVPSGSPRVVYFPSCLSRVLGPQPGETGPSTAEAITRVLAYAGYEVVHPEGLSGLCCGMPFSSKAFSGAAQVAGGRTLEALRRASENGARPIVTDASPCAGTLKELLAEEARGVPPLHLFDFPSFWAREALPRLPHPRRRRGLAVLHPTCSLVKQGGVADLVAVARAHAEEAMVPSSAECCGFAGDKGFLVPELTQSATAVEAAEIRERLERHARPLASGAPDQPAGAGAVYSTCRTCEIGMSRAVGQPVRGIAHLVLEALERA